MNLRRFSVSLAAGLFLCSTTAMASAATFDFVNEANTNGERAVANGTSFTDDSLTVSLSASMLDGSTTAGGGGLGGGPFPYLDASLSGAPGGLGVCQAIDSNRHCAPPSDDNITAGEVITLDFGLQTVNIQQIDFSNGGHQPNFTGDAAYLIGTLTSDLNEWTRFTPEGMTTFDLTGNVFHFISNASFGGSGDQSELYLNVVTAEPVPVPSAFILFATGLGAMLGGRYVMNKRKA